MTDEIDETTPSSPAFVTSRRSFFGVGAGAAMLGLVPVASLAAAPNGNWDHEADVVVVGGGAAGGCAAAKALDRGCTVIVVERAAIVGGTAAKSGGSYWIPNNSLLRKEGIDDPRDDAIRVMARLAHPNAFVADVPRFGLAQLDYDLLAAYYDHGARAVDDLARMGALQSVQYADSAGKPNFVDYWYGPDNKAPLGRGLRATSRSGHGGPPDGRGGNGADMIGQLYDFFDKRGGTTLTDHRVSALVSNAAGEVIGVRASTGEGAAVSIRARRGVVFASGGFAQNVELTRRHLRGPVLGACAVPGSQGDFLAIAAGVGAQMGNLGTAWWSEVLVEQAVENRVSSTLIAIPADSLILVSKYGRRVVDEKALHHERSQIHFVWDPDRFEFPNLILFAIWDQHAHDKFAGQFPIPQAGATSPYVIQADTMQALADRIDERLTKLGPKVGRTRLADSFKATLEETVARYNRMAAAARDEDFRRGEVPAETWFHRRLLAGGTYDPNAPNDMLAPLAPTGPYYAALIGPGALDTNGGPLINARAQVLNAAGAPIAGLYGAGNCVAAISGVGNWAGGGTLGPALTYGFLAGENAAAEPIKAAT